MSVVITARTAPPNEQGCLHCHRHDRSSLPSRQLWAGGGSCGAVELAAGAGGSTASTIPQRVTREEIRQFIVDGASMVSCVAKVVVSNESGGVWPSIAVSTITHECRFNTQVSISPGTSEGPDMLPSAWPTVSERNTIQVWHFQGVTSCY